MKILKKDFWKGKTGLLKKIGIVGFMFFLIKGLIWVGVAIFVWLGISS